MNKLAGGLAAALERLEREAREYVADREQSSGANEALAVIDADHPFHAAVRAVEALCGGKLPSAAWSHWRLLLRTSRADDATPAEYEGAILAVEAIANWAAMERRDESVGSPIDAEQKRWVLEPGGYWFDGRFYPLVGRPLALLRVFIESPRRATFGYRELERAWGDDQADDSTIKRTLSTLRRSLSQVAVDASIDCPDPVPGKQGAWQFALPR